MKTVYFLSLLGSAMGYNTANVPPELSVIGSPDWTLPATFSASAGNCSVAREVAVVPGKYLKTDETQHLPQISIANISRSYDLNANASTKYVFLMVDPDYNKTTPTNVILHTLWANITAEGSLTTSSEVTKYLTPQPQPVGATHNYTLLLFRQPEGDFTIPAEYASYVATNSHTPYNRINLPLPQFLSDTGLGKPVAANWFKEKATGSSKSATKTPSCSTPSASVTPSATASGTPSPTAVHTGLAVSVHGMREVGFLAGLGGFAAVINAL